MIAHSQCQVKKYIARDLSLRICSVNLTSIAEEVRNIQHLTPLPSIVMGRLLVASALLASQLKDHQKIGIHFRGNGPLGSLFAEAHYEGALRAKIGNPFYIADNESDFFNLRKAIGTGQLNIDHNLKDQTKSYRGTVNIQTGEIGDDIAYYLMQSQQIPSVVSLGVHLNSNAKIDVAAGVLIQILPGTDPKILTEIENNLKQAHSISTLILQGKTEDDLIHNYLLNKSIDHLPHPYHVHFHCPCSKERVMNSLTLLGSEELKSIQKEKNCLDIKCEFCGTKYVVDSTQIAKIIQTIRTDTH